MVNLGSQKSYQGSSTLLAVAAKLHSPPEVAGGETPRLRGDGRNLQKTPGLGGGNSNMFCFHPESLGKIPNLTNIFQMG